MEKRINMTPDSMTFKTKENGAQYGWKHETEKLINKLNITPDDMEGSREHTKNAAKGKVNTRFREEIESNGQGKSKVRYLLDGKNEEWNPGKPARYILDMTGIHVSTICKAKTRI